MSYLYITLKIFFKRLKTLKMYSWQIYVLASISIIPFKILPLNE